MNSTTSFKTLRVRQHLLPIQIPKIYIRQAINPYERRRKEERQK